MKKTYWAMIYVFCATVACFCGPSATAHSAETNAAESQWTKWPQLSPDQQKLLSLRKSATMGREDSPVRAQRQADLAALQKKLGPLAVREAKPNELVMTATHTNICTIHNPTSESLVLTVSIVGDTEQWGTKMASIGRQAYFPPGSSLVVTNLYWTSPATAKQAIH